MENHICKKCGGIAGWDPYFQAWICTRCGNMERKPITNADRIRAMSDEELAVFMFTANGCPMWVGDYSCKEGNGCHGAGNACWLYWLKQEVEK